MTHGMIRRPDGTDVMCTYYPEVFDVPDLEYGKRLTVTREGSLTSEVRWDVETEFTIDTLLSFVSLNKQSVVLDYGCGVGRLAKALIERVGCHVVGVDTSHKMRKFARQYVNDSRFQACSSEILLHADLKFDCAIAAWVLQHCLSPDIDLDLIHAALKSNAWFFVLGGFVRKIPIVAPADPSLCWLDDGIDVHALSLNRFDCVQQGSFTPSELTKLNDGNYWAMYQRNGR